DEEDRTAREEAGLDKVEEKLERKRRKAGEASPTVPPAAFTPGDDLTPGEEQAPTIEPEVVEPVPVKPRFRDRLTKARSRLAGVVGSLRKAKIDDDAWDELEEALIGADVGIEPTQELLDHLRARVADEGLTEGGQL